MSGSRRLRASEKRAREILLSPNGSPYEIDKDERRIAARGRASVETGLPFAYLNRVGGQDELAFDGASFVLNGDGSLACQMADWRGIATAPTGRDRNGAGLRAGEIAPLADPDRRIVYSAMIVGLRDYVNRNRFPGVVLGLSGGIDSARSPRPWRSMRWAPTGSGA
jgi:NAD+ synthase